MTEPLELPSRRVIEKALRDAGLSHRQSRKMLSVAWPLVVGEAKAEAEKLQAELDDLRALFAESTDKGL